MQTRSNLYDTIKIRIKKWQKTILNEEHKAKKHTMRKEGDDSYQERDVIGFIAFLSQFTFMSESEEESDG
ncbi:hypothetical protein [Bacillus atrophaeus]|uniref:hypothetical protein n=1 Tax=Bacillus atrophaeus TaxID=1452 RepID=UPI000779E21A|nr:hypothetical protein [Bacillus atrophaeus]KYD04506.1 hypothetical protein B4144_1101 [Bacillus atrophaeus]